MYVQLLVFKTAPNMQAPVETLADNAYAALKNAPGFKSATYFGDPDTNESLDLAFVITLLYLWPYRFEHLCSQFQRCTHVALSIYSDYIICGNGDS